MSDADDEPDSPDSLVRRFNDGDQQALAAAFASHRQRLLRTVQFRLDRRLWGRIDPEDVLQEAYLAAADRIEHFKGDSPSSLYVWLRLIVTQTMVDLHRRHLGAQARDADREVRLPGPTPGTSSCMAIQLSGNLTSPSYAAIREEEASRLQLLIEQMDEIDREVLALRHFEELTNSETAEVLGIQAKAASIRYVRALGRLKSVMSKAAAVSQSAP